MHSAKSIDELYDEVRDYDLVLCNDAPLALALNNRVDRARLGKFAYTMREFARERLVDFIDEPMIGDIELVRRVADSTGYDIRFVHAEIENIRRMQRFISDVRAYLGKRSAKVWDEYVKYMTLERLIDIYEATKPPIYAPYSRIAAIGVEDNLFDNMDKKMLPRDFDDIPIVRYIDYEIEEVRLLGNDKQIADCAVDIAVRSNPKDVAIVLDSSGPIADAVRSALYRVQVPFINSLSVKDLHSIRNYLQFIRLALSYRTVRVRDVRSLISSYRGRLQQRHDEYSLHRFFESGTVKDEHTVELLTCMRDVSDLTFSDICARCVPGPERANIRILLAQMDCADKRVTDSILEDLVYAVNNIGNLPHNEQIPQDEKEGVLIADCKNSMYVDRPIVIYAGLGVDWNRELKGMDSLKTDLRREESYRNDTRFCVLIQQGSVRYHFANATKGGKAAIPCMHFERCMDGRLVTDFSDVCNTITRGAWHIDMRDRGVDHDCMDVDNSANMPRYLSPSAYNAYYSCPRSYVFRTLAPSAENENLLVGTMVHDYAEFRISYPEKAAEHPPEYYADMIADICAPLQSEEAAEVERAKIRLSCRAVDEMVASKNLGPAGMRRRSSDKIEPNMFFELYGLEDVSEYTEKKILDSDNRMEGDMDLYTDRFILDYKTGTKKSPETMNDAMNFNEDPSKRKVLKYGYDLQPLFYLALARSKGDTPKVFQYFSTKELYRMGLTSGMMDIQDCYTSVHVEDNDMDMMVSSKTFDKRNYKKCANEMREMLRDNPDQGFWKDDSNLSDVLVDMGYSKGTASTLIKEISSLFDREVVQADDERVCVSEDTLVRLREMVRKDYERIAKDFFEGGEGSFPARPCRECSNCGYKDMCTVEPMTEVDSDDE